MAHNVAFSRALQRVGCKAVLCGFCHMKKGTLDGLRGLDFNEPIRRVKIVFTAFVHYPHVAIRRRCFVWDDAINLVQL